MSATRGASALERVESALREAGCTERSGNWSCPAHEDNEPSLHVTSDRRGVAMKCHANCDIRDILSVLGLEWGDLFAEPMKEVARYPYQNNGQLFEKVRFQADGKKTFRWEPALNGHRMPLYRLEEALALPDPVYLIESEKDVDALLAMNVAATCQPGGAGDWHDSYTDSLRGRDVTVVADRDAPGVQHALKVHADLTGKAASVRIVQSKTTGEHDDVGDHLRHHTLDELVPLHPENEISRRYRRTNWHDAFKASDGSVDWLYEPIFESGTINALFGKPGVGKSLLTWDFAVTLVREGKRVMVIDDENREQDTVKRLRAFGCTPDELDNLVLYSFAGLPPLDSPEGGQHLTALAEINDPAFVVLDTTTRMVEGDENNSSTWLQLYRCSLVPLKQKGITTLRIDHPGKDETRGQRGSSAKAGDVDCIFRLSDISNSDSLVLICEKSRSGNQETAITMKRMKDPLRHQVTALGDLDILPQVQAVSRWFDNHDTAKDAGRPRLRDILNNTKGAPEISTTMLALVARFRRGQVQDSEGQEWSPSGRLGVDEDGCPF